MGEKRCESQLLHHTCNDAKSSGNFFDMHNFKRDLGQDEAFS